MGNTKCRRKIIEIDRNGSDVEKAVYRHRVEVDKYSNEVFKDEKHAEGLFFSVTISSFSEFYHSQIIKSFGKHI